MGEVSPDEIRALAFGLELSLVSLAEVIAWADHKLASSDYDDRIADISLIPNDGHKEAHSILAGLSSDACDWESLRILAPKIARMLEKEPLQMHLITQFLERVWVRHEYDQPEDFSFVIGVEDEFLLAEQRVAGSLDELRTRLIEFFRAL